MRAQTLRNEKHLPTLMGSNELKCVIFLRASHDDPGYFFMWVLITFKTLM